MDCVQPSSRQAKRLRWAALGAIMLCAPLPAHAQGTDIGGQSSTTSADDTPAFLASGGGRIFNTAGNPSTGTTSGENSPAVAAVQGGIADLAGGGTFTTSGFFSPAILSVFDNSFFTGTDVHILTTGNNSEGAAAEEGGTIVLNGGTIRTEGTHSYGLHANHFDTNRITSSAVITTIGPSSFGAFLNGLGFAHLLL